MAFGAIAIDESKHVSDLAGTELIASYKQSERVTRYFCNEYRSRLPIAKPWNARVGIPAGLLDGDIDDPARASTNGMPG